MTDSPTSTDEILRGVQASGHGSSSENRLQGLGRELVNRIFMLYRTGRIHSIENQATLTAVDELRRVLAALMEDNETVTLAFVGEGFYLNRVMLKVDFSAFENFEFLTKLFSHYDISSLTFIGVPEPDDVRSFLTALLKARPDPQDPGWVGHLSLKTIKIGGGRKLTETVGWMISKETLSDTRYLLRLYLKTVFLFQRFITQIQEGESPAVGRFQRMIHELIDASEGSKDALLALTVARDVHEYLAYHSVNVSILSLLMGMEIGADRRMLSDLGMAALLHDVGKIQIPEEVLRKMNVTPEELSQMKKTNTLSLLQLIRLRGFNESALRRMMVAYEHTLDAGPESSRRPTVFSQIVGIAHCYDAMTTHQPYRDALLPDEALRIMKKEEGSRFDPVLLNAFIRLLTPYPPGTLVRLNTNEVAIVLDSGERRPSADKPFVQVLYDPAGALLSEFKLSLARDATGRKISQVLDASKFRIRPLRYLFPELAKSTAS